MKLGTIEFNPRMFLTLLNSTSKGVNLWKKSSIPEFILVFTTNFPFRKNPGFDQVIDNFRDFIMGTVTCFEKMFAQFRIILAKLGTAIATVNPRISFSPNQE
jgi:hypothetical protein